MPCSDRAWLMSMASPCGRPSTMSRSSIFSSAPRRAENRAASPPTLPDPTMVSTGAAAGRAQLNLVRPRRGISDPRARRQGGRPHRPLHFSSSAM